MNFHPHTFLETLPYMGLGMLGIMIVMLVLIGIVALLNKLTADKKDDQPHS